MSTIAFGLRTSVDGRFSPAFFPDDQLRYTVRGLAKRAAGFVDHIPDLVAYVRETLEPYRIDRIVEADFNLPVRGAARQANLPTGKSLAE